MLREKHQARTGIAWTSACRIVPSEEKARDVSDAGGKWEWGSARCLPRQVLGWNFRKQLMQVSLLKCFMSATIQEAQGRQERGGKLTGCSVREVGAASESITDAPGTGWQMR